MHIVRLEKVKREQDHRRGKPEPSGVVAVGLLGKQVPFLQRLLLYRRLPLWIAFFYYLLFLNEQKTVKQVSFINNNNKKKKLERNLSDLHLWGSFCILAHRGMGWDN